MEVYKLRNEEQQYDAVANEIKDKELFKIVHPTGWIEINIEKFFPCTLIKARKIFSLINRYSSKEVKKALLLILQEKESRYAASMTEYAAKITLYQAKSKESRFYAARFKEAKRLRQRMERNIEIFLAGRE